MTNLGKIEEGLFHEIHADENFQIGDLEISPFTISHDAAEPVAYRVACGGKKWRWPQIWEFIRITLLSI
ncbi:MAG: hypothetical protein V8Q27_04370 [Eubacteriales bacterium]